MRRLLAVELGAFGFFGIFWGTFAVLLADLSASLGLSPGPLGLALFVGAAASILAMALLGWTADRLGRRAFLTIFGGVFGVGPSPGTSPRAGAAISVVTTLGYGGFLLGPVVVGGLAELFGLRVALGTIAAAGLLIFTFALRLRDA